VPVGQFALGFGEDARPRGAVGQRFGSDDGILQQGLLVRAVGIGARRPALDHVLAIGLQQGDVDAVERSARHEANRG